MSEYIDSRMHNTVDVHAILKSMLIPHATV